LRVFVQFRLLVGALFQALTTKFPKHRNRESLMAVTGKNFQRTGNFDRGSVPVTGGMYH
jgi:hypothetical protein